MKEEGKRSRNKGFFSFDRFGSNRYYESSSPVLPEYEDPFPAQGVLQINL